MTQKIKLTLSIDKGVVKSVKKSGVCISNLVENYLKFGVNILPFPKLQGCQATLQAQYKECKPSERVYKKDLQSYVCFRKTEGISKSHLYQISWMLNNYLDYCNWKPDKDTTIRYLNKIQKKYSVSFYRKQVLQIRLFLRYQGHTYLDSMKVVREPDYRPIAIRAIDIENTLAYFDSHRLREQLRAITLLGASSGLRPFELYQLRVDDIDIDNRVVGVYHKPQEGLTTKTKQSRVSFFDYEAQEALRAYMAIYEANKRTKYLFGESHILRAYRKAPLQVKDLRKAFSQEWTKRDGNAQVLEVLLGHSTRDNVTLQHYVKLDTQELKHVYDGVMCR